MELLDRVRIGLRMGAAVWHEWIDEGSIKTLSHHASGVIVALILFGAVETLARYIITDQQLHSVFSNLEGIVLIGLVLWFTYQLIVILWNRRARIDRTLGILAA